MKKNGKSITVVFVFLLGAIFSSCTGSSPQATAPTVIKIGYVASFSGWLAADAELTQWTNYELWAQNVNENGGIYVKEFDKSIPVQTIFYDDKSDPGTTAKMYEKLILEDKVHFLFPPFGTAWHFSSVPIANKYGYQMIAVTVSSKEMWEKALDGTLPYYFQDWPSAQDQVPYLADLSGDLGVKSAAFIYLSTTSGIEWSQALVPALQSGGMEVKKDQSYPVDMMDFSPLLKELKAQNVDALYATSYGSEGALIVEQMMAIDYNPKLFWLFSTGWSSPTYIQKFGKTGALDGIMSEGVMNPDMGYPGLKEYWDRYTQKFQREPDYANGPHIYATCEIYQQAIEEAGTLDRAAVRDIMATEEFTTITGTFSFSQNYRWPEDQPGIVGQWQNGNLEVVSPGSMQTATPIYPKPAWPK